MIDVNFEYYHTIYKGSLDEQTFEKFLDKAYITIDNFCFGRFEKADEHVYSEFNLKKIKFCVCAVVDQLNSITMPDGVAQVGVKSAESVGPWSVSYNASSLPSSVMAGLKDLVMSYLGGTNLMVAWC